MVPLLPLFAGVGFGLSTIYNTGKALDNRRYWNDYYRNTGYRPRYPYRAGVYDWMKDFGKTAYGAVGYYSYNSKYWR